MKSQTFKNIRYQRVVITIVLLFAVTVISFTQDRWRIVKATPENYPSGVYFKYFNDDGGVNFYLLDSVYQANMTFLLEKKTFHPYIVVDIDKANIPYNITEKELIKSPYCYLTIASSGNIYLRTCLRDLPMFVRQNDSIFASDFFDLSDWTDTKTWWIYKRVAFWKKEDLKKSPYKNFYVVPFYSPTNKAVLCMMKAKLINKYTGVLIWLSYDSKDITSFPEDERIMPYKFENPEAFYKVLFPYIDEVPPYQMF